MKTLLLGQRVASARHRAGHHQMLLIVPMVVIAVLIGLFTAGASPAHALNKAPYQLFEAPVGTQKIWLDAEPADAAHTLITAYLDQPEIAESEVSVPWAQTGFGSSAVIAMVPFADLRVGVVRETGCGAVCDQPIDLTVTFMGENGVVLSETLLRSAVFGSADAAGVSWVLEYEEPEEPEEPEDTPANESEPAASGGSSKPDTVTSQNGALATSGGSNAAWVWAAAGALLLVGGGVLWASIRRARSAARDVATTHTGASATTTDTAAAPQIDNHEGAN